MYTINYTKIHTLVIFFWGKTMEKPTAIIIIINNKIKVHRLQKRVRNS
jgi:hypothetical protein